MKKRLNLYLFPLLIAIVLMAASQTTKAEDACVWHSWLNNEDDARAICPGICEKSFPDSKWNGQWVGHSENCWWMAWECSACGCNLAPPCKCAAGKQTPDCDESKNPLGPGKCKADCDCAEGEFCDNDGWCQKRCSSNSDCRYDEYCDPNGECIEDPNCCSKSMNAFTACTLRCQPCNGEGCEPWVCPAACEVAYKRFSSQCNNGKGGCPPAPLPPKSPSKNTSLPKSMEEKNQQEKGETLPLTPMVPFKEKEEPKAVAPESPKVKEEPKESSSESPKVKEEPREHPTESPKVKEEPKKIIPESPKEKEEPRERS